MTAKKEQKNPFLKTALSVTRTAALATLVAATVALVVNALRPDGLPLVADKPYEILVPCPEPGGEVSPVTPADASLLSKDTFIVDARTKTAFDAWRFGHAENLTYDYLDPVPEADIKALTREIAASRAKRVVVYGDGDTPDTGEQLGKELSGHGIKNVCFVKGGAPALLKRKTEEK